MIFFQSLVEKGNGTLEKMFQSMQAQFQVIFFSLKVLKKKTKVKINTFEKSFSKRHFHSSLFYKFIYLF